MRGRESTRSALVLIFLIVCIVAAELNVTMDRQICRVSVEAMQKMGNFTKNEPRYFSTVVENGVRRLLNGSDMALTYFGCEEFCGPWSWYFDKWPRITTWIIPVFLLISNSKLLSSCCLA